VVPKSAEDIPAVGSCVGVGGTANVVPKSAEDIPAVGSAAVVEVLTLLAAGGGAGGAGTCGLGGLLAGAGAVSTALRGTGGEIGITVTEPVGIFLFLCSYLYLK
jgi:hypothetical protein